MQPSRRHCLCASLAVAVILCLGQRTFAETLTITTSPPGADLEMDGVAVGTTPYRIEYPGGYFHKPHTAFSARLQHAVVLRVSKDGYLTQQITISTGPFEWIGLTGKHHGNYFLLRSDHFDIKLEPTLVGWTKTIEAGSRAGPIKPRTISAADADVASETGSIVIATDSPGAEIYVDGKFVGQTPSTIRLPSGSHRVEVKSQGKQTWQRDLEVWKDSQLTLHPLLEPGEQR